MDAGRTDLKIPYGIADFKRIRNEGWYYVDKTEYLARPAGGDSGRKTMNFGMIFGQMIF